MMEEETVNNFINCCQGISGLNLEIGSSGNLSFREGNKIVITPTGIDFAQISKEKLSILNLEGTVNLSGMRPSSDVEYHKKLFLVRHDVKAILHTHSHYITLLSMIDSKYIPILNTMHADYFGKRIQCIPFSNHRKTGFGDMNYFRDGEAFLLAKHGGLILFTEINTEKIINTMNAFAEVSRLYYEYLLYAKLSDIKTEEISEEDVDLIHRYYKDNYGIIPKR